MREDQAALGLTDVGLAAKAGVHQTSVGRWFSGASSSVRLAHKLAEALEQDVRRYIISAQEVSSALPPLSTDPNDLPPGVVIARTDGEPIRVDLDPERHMTGEGH